MNMKFLGVRSGVCWRLPPVWLLALGLSLALVRPVVSRAADGGEIIAVSSRVSEEYVRNKLPDGSYPVETYTFGEGGCCRSPVHDDTIDKLKFLDVARVIAGPLAKRNYLPATDQTQVKFLIMVYWGTTAGAGGASSSIAYQNASVAGQRLANAISAANKAPDPNAGRGSDRSGENAQAASVRNSADSEFAAAMALVQMQNRERDRNNWRNAGMLGYDEALVATNAYEGTPIHGVRGDLISDLEDDRYFVVLMAFDFPLLLKEKKHKLLWETRFSISAHRHDFAKELEAMSGYASRFFGQETHGVLRQPLPEGTVEFGELKTLGIGPEKEAPAAGDAKPASR